MSTGIVAAGAAAIAYFAYVRSKKDLRDSEAVVETHARFEHAPTDWTGEIFLFAEALRYIYVETLARWPTADLFIGLVYLARQGLRDFPAKEIVAHGRQVDINDLSLKSRDELRNKLKTLHRLLLYSQNLKYCNGPIILEGIWGDVGLKKEDFIIYHPKAAVLKPAFILAKDKVLKSLVLAVRGTQTVKDIFTSLSSAGKPHHMVNNRGVVLGHSHFGMLASARWLLKQVVPLITEGLQDNPGYSLLVTGHSMGGGTAAILTMMLREQFPNFGDVQCVTFACPGCVTVDIAQSCSEYITTVVYGTDVVPTLSPAALDHLREDVAKSSWSRGFKQDVRSSNMVQAVEGRLRGLLTSVSSFASTSLQGCTRARPHKAGVTVGESQDLDVVLEGESSPHQGDKYFANGTDRHCCIEGQDVVELPVSRSAEIEPSGGQVAEITSANNNSHTEMFGTITSPAAKANLLERSLSIGSISRDTEQADLDAMGLEDSKKPDSQQKMSFWARMWLKGKKSASAGTSQERMLSDMTDEAGEIAECLESEEVEGVFNGRAALDGDDQQVAEAEEGTSSAQQDVLRKRQLYPAGRIFHLVPAFILNADNSLKDSNQESGEDLIRESGHEAFMGSDWCQSTSVDGPDGEESNGTKDEDYVLFMDVPQEAYCRVRMSRSMVVDHFVPRYKAAIESLLENIDNAAIF